MHDSKSKRSRSFPLWLFALFLFAVIVAFFVIRIPRIMSSNTPEETEVPPIVTTEPVSEAEPVPEQPAEAEAEPDGGEGALIVTDSAVNTEGTPAGSGSDLIITEPEVPAVHIHSYRNGVCSTCGATPEFLTGFLPDELYRSCEHAGKVIEYDYSVTAYANHGNGEYDKTLCIYLPYGYDETKPYDVLVLVHGGGGDQNSWLNTVYDYGDVQMCGRNIFDNMFEQGLAKPCIIVCPAMETPLCQGLTAGINQLRDELRNDILPYIAENYSTYAEDGSLESLQAARDHFALGGLSNGALFVYEGGMRYNFDLFGSYAAFSGNGEPWKTVGIIQAEPYADLPIHCLFTGAGTWNDAQQNYTLIGYEYFLENEPRVEEGKNAWHVDVEGEHEWKVWLTDIYNALPLMFQETD